MQIQNYQNHRKLKPETRSHLIYYICVVSLFVFTIIDLWHAICKGSGRFTASLLVLTSFSLIVAYFLFRSFSLKAQDRAIRAEENLRHFVLTGKLLDKTLTISQIIALRFAPDEEFIGLAERAVKENLSNDGIKKTIKNWKADNHRA
jgi:hypothetical protein